VFSGTGGGIYGIEFNGDTSTIYSRVFMTGNGSSTNSGTGTHPFCRMIGLNGSQHLIISQIMDYTATDKHKTVLSRPNRPSGTVVDEISAFAHRYASTSAITSVKALADGSTFDSGTTFSLYGIEK